MSNKGYIVLAVLALAALFFLARPQAKEEIERLTPIYDGSPAPFTLIAHGLTQDLSDRGEFTIDNVKRPLDAKASEAFWDLIKAAPIARSAQEREGVTASQAVAYGIDLSAPSLIIKKPGNRETIRWAMRDDLCYVYNEKTQRIIQFPAQHFVALSKASERLDFRRLLPGHSPTKINVDGTAWQLRGKGLVRHR